MPQLDAKLPDVPHGEILPQAGEQFAMAPNRVFMIPWGHIKVLIDNCHANLAKFSFYVDKVIDTDSQ